MENALQHSPYAQRPYFTLRWQDRLVHVSKTQTPHYQALTRSPCFHNDVLTLPPAPDMPYFDILQQFILHGYYTPTLTQSLQILEASGMHISSMGLLAVGVPPCILPPDTRAPAFLLHSVLAYNLAKHVGLEPMAINALKRLCAGLPFSAEDPTLILENIYVPNSPNTPHADLRDWARKWLSHRLYTTLGDHATIYKTNLGVLEQHPLLTEKFSGLQYTSKYLLEDVNYVRYHYPVSRGPQTPQPNSTPGVIEWPNSQTLNGQPTGSGVYGHQALVNNTSRQIQELPWFPPVEPSWTSASSVSDAFLEEQRVREQLRNMNI